MTTSQIIMAIGFPLTIMAGLVTFCNIHDKNKKAEVKAGPDESAIDVTKSFNERKNVNLALGHALALEELSKSLVEKPVDEMIISEFIEYLKTKEWSRQVPTSDGTGGYPASKEANHSSAVMAAMQRQQEEARRRTPTVTQQQMVSRAHRHSQTTPVAIHDWPVQAMAMNVHGSHDSGSSSRSCGGSTYGGGDSSPPSDSGGGGGCD